MMSLFRRLIIIAMLCSSATLFADDLLLKSGIKKNQLVELYTSEGCSSCPSADKWISKLKTNSDLWTDVVPIAFHVDYWDRLGWKDELARKEFSDRQRRYHQQGLISQVYTPGFVVDGQEWRGFFKRNMLKPTPRLDVGEITLQISAASINAKFHPQLDVNEEVVFHVALLGFDIETEIQAGENSGKTLNHDFAVIAYDAKKASRNDNVFTTAMDIPATNVNVDRKAIVVWVSEPDSQSPLQVVGNWL